MATYKDPSAQLTLREALEEFCEVHAESLYSDEMSEDSQTFFRNHDVAHVIFGCDTSLAQEALVKGWIAFGTTLGFWGHIKEYSRVETREIVRDLRAREVLSTIFSSLVLMPRVIVRCRSMSKKWPWDRHADYYDRSLVQIRREFNIRPISSR